MRAFAAAVLFAVAVTSPAAAQTLPAPAILQAGLAGSWTGALGYRDYQSNKLFELAVQTKIEAVSDGATVLRVSSFDDGPKVGFVYITTASLYGPRPGSVTSVTLRKGRAVEVVTDRVTTTTYTDALHWTVQYERDGTDGDQPARIRITETRDGETVLAIKEVMPSAEATKGWQFRNQTRLTKVSQ